MLSVWISTGTGWPMTRWPISTATASPTMPCSIWTTTAFAESCSADDGLGPRRWLRTGPRVRRDPAKPDGASRSTASLGLDGVERTGGRLVDFDGDGPAEQAGCSTATATTRPTAQSSAGDNGVTGYVDADGDGRWDVELTNTDGDGTARMRPARYSPGTSPALLKKPSAVPTKSVLAKLSDQRLRPDDIGCPDLFHHLIAP